VARPRPLAPGIVERRQAADAENPMYNTPDLNFDELPAPPWRLACLVLHTALPQLHTARERLDAALGPELARFLVMALSGSHGRAT
jgi:hypothetical protein